MFEAQTVFSDSWTPRSNPSRPDLLYATAGLPEYLGANLPYPRAGFPESQGPTCHVNSIAGSPDSPDVRAAIYPTAGLQNPSELDLLYQTAGLPEFGPESLEIRRAVNLTAGPSCRILCSTTCSTSQLDPQNPSRHNLLYATAGLPECIEAQPVMPDSWAPKIPQSPTCHTQQLKSNNPPISILLPYEYPRAALAESLEARSIKPNSWTHRISQGPTCYTAPRIPGGPACYTREQDSQNHSRPDVLYPTAGLPAPLET